MPRSRIPIFTSRMEALCDEAGLPRFDETKYDLLSDTLLFLWHDPKFCLAAQLASASIHGMGASDVLEAWERKFGPVSGSAAA
ncbi:MAG: hypothetical protein AAGC46_20215 [Solirubrobacteraceae bacterium]|nr:hypothetical protein [Patulibacter sp.]